MRWRLNLLVVVALLVFCVLGQHFVFGQSNQQTHVVQSGETLFHIALTYGITVDQLATANNITDPTRIFVGQVLVIPVPPVAGAANPVAPTNAPPVNVNTNPVVPSTTSFVYVVQAGDTLSIISRRFNVSLGALLSANPSADPDHIIPGQQLVIPGANSVTPIPTIAPLMQTSLPGPTARVLTATPAPTVVPVVSNQPMRTYTVQPGEDLAQIALRYGVSWPAIAAANNISDPNTIYTGQVLQIPTSDIGVNPGNVPDASSQPVPDLSLNKEIVVVLHEQRIYVYENSKMIRTSLASTGLPGSPTVQGDFHIYVKYTSQLMVGPGYYLPGVPWVMYFYQDYGLHGTYWHNNFGHPMSHGCVNLPTPEAEWLYNWAEIGTLVHVQW